MLDFWTFMNFNPLRTEGIFRKLQKVMKKETKSGQILKIMEPHESLDEDLSNKYQCYRVSIASKIFIIFLC
jgi:hypothetical protein